MRRNILNHHKYKRRWGRGLKKASTFLLNNTTDESKHKDFAWHNSKCNPLWGERKCISWRKRIEIGTIAISFLVMICISIYSGFFKLNDIKINGLQRISEKEISETVFGVVNYRRFLIFPGQNYFVVNLDEIRDIIKERFPIESIIVKKIFPNTLQITLEEKISTIIYDNGSEYSYLGTEGKIVEIIRKIGDDEWQREIEIVTSTNELGEEIKEEKIISEFHKPNITNIIKEMGDYPIIYDTRKQKIDINFNVLDEAIVRGTINWFNLINKNTDIPFGYIIIENGIGDGVIKTRNGYDLVVKLNININEQFAELQYVLKQKARHDNLNYIDLRFPGKVYWQ